MDDPEIRERRDRAIRERPIGGKRWRAPVAIAAAVLAVMATPVVLTRLLTPAEPGWSANGVTLNTTSSDPSDDASEALIISVVRLDANGCVYLKSPGSVRNVVWPDGYTAPRQPDGSVIIANEDGDAVAAVGRRIRASSVAAPLDTELACSAQGSYPPTLLIQDELPPLID